MKIIIIIVITSLLGGTRPQCRDLFLNLKDTNASSIRCYALLLYPLTWPQTYYRHDCYTNIFVSANLTKVKKLNFEQMTFHKTFRFHRRTLTARTQNIRLQLHISNKNRRFELNRFGQFFQISYVFDTCIFVLARYLFYGPFGWPMLGQVRLTYLRQCES